MANVLHFGKFLLQTEPQNNAARLALYHYLKFYAESSQDLSLELFQNFYRRALSFKFWQDNRLGLAQEIRKLIKQFEKEHKYDLNLAKLKHGDEIQIISIESEADQYELLHQYLGQQSNQQQLRLVRSGPGEFLSLQMDSEANLKLGFFNRDFMIQKAKLIPLCEDISLSYNSDLELKAKVLQHIRLDANHVAQFTYSAHTYNGRILRGYSFQKHSEFINKDDLNEIPELFYALKRYESHFIQRNSDPVYLELCNLLEKAIDLLQQNHPEAQEIALRALKRGQNSVENIFPDDKMLRLLLKELANVVSSKNQNKDFSRDTLCPIQMNQEFDLTNLLPIVE